MKEGRQMEVISPEDIALLKRFEPILCYNVGEQFYPMDADLFISQARLCVHRPNAVDVVLVSQGQLTGDQLTQVQPDNAEAVFYLNAVEPLKPAQVLAFRRNSTLRDFHAGQGRLARVGILARVADLLFSLTLLLRGKVPGGMAAAAALRYKELLQRDKRYCYYGRVVREHGYIALQYWFFYAFNDWRSSFHGVNDHEGDWEMITVYVVEDVSGTIQPGWVSYSSHEFDGDDLRRRWDDPELQREGEHPLVYVAAGSHSNYYYPGEYQPVTELPYASTLLRFWRRVQRFWRVTLRQGGELSDAPVLGLVHIPFVDFARGDGVRIGPGQKNAWEQKLLQSTDEQPAPTWVAGYRGLWGLYTGDPISGEDAPAGPKYDRDGTVSKAWYNPLGWSGLDKVPPPREEAVFLELQQQRLHEEQIQLQRQIADKMTLLIGMEMESEAIYGLPHLLDRAAELQQRIEQASEELDALKSRRATNALVLEACAVNTPAGKMRGPRDHLRVPQTPTSAAELRLSRLAEVWSALSIGVLLLSFIIILQFATAWEAGLLALLGVYIFIEALFRRQMQRVINYAVVSLAIITSVVLVFEFFGAVIITLVLLAGLFIIVENVRELRSSSWTTKKR
jgi:hypothetical protein